MEIDIILAKDQKTFPGQGAISTKVLVLAFFMFYL